MDHNGEIIDHKNPRKASKDPEINTINTEDLSQNSHKHTTEVKTFGFKLIFRLNTG